MKEIQRRSKFTMTAIRNAIKRGYHVLEDGTLVSSKDRILSPYVKITSGIPYFWVSVRDPIIGHRNFTLHQLAAYQWYGEKVFVPGIEVRHLDGNSMNNSRTNIVLGKHYDNMMDIPKEVRDRSAKTAARALRKLTDEEVELLRADRRAGFKYKELMAKYDIAKSTVSYIVNRKTYPETKPA